MAHFCSVRRTRRKSPAPINFQTRHLSCHFEISKFYFKPNIKLFANIVIKMESLLDNPDTEYLQNELRALAELIQEQVEEPPRVGETISREGVRINFPVKPCQ